MKNIKLFFLTLLISTMLSAQNGYNIGDVATDFRLENIDGNFISLSDFSKAKGFYFNIYMQYLPLCSCL